MGASNPDSPDSRSDLDARAHALAELLGLSGLQELDRLTDQLARLKRAREQNAPKPRSGYDIGGPLAGAGMEVVGLDPTDAIEISPGRRPRGSIKSWGLSTHCVRVTSELPFPRARIRFVLPSRTLKKLYPGTIVAARWTPLDQRFRLVPASGYSESGRYVYAQITRPGIYAAIGLPRDPRLWLALQVLNALRPWACAVKEGGAAICGPVLDALLRQPLLDQVSRDGALRDAFAFRATDFPANTREALDDLVPSGGKLEDVIDRLPELDLLEAFGGPNRLMRPMPEPRLPDAWPMPRGRWQSLGPDTVTGRIKCLAVHPEHGEIVYAGAAGGGVWKTVDGGRNWAPTMHDEPSLAIGGLALAPSNPEIVYAATGEWTGNKERPTTPSGMGAGVMRSADGGRCWEKCGPIESFLCTGMAIHPDDPDCVYVSGNRGLHATQDGGLTWRRLPVAAGRKFATPETVSSVVLDAANPERLFAAVHKTGLFASADGGESWLALNDEANGLPTGETANAPRIALGRIHPGGSKAIAVKMGDVVYLSNDGGQRFRRIADLGDRSSGMMPWCSLIAIDHRNPDLLFAGGTNLHRSEDGGRSWSKVAGYGTAVHEDQQHLVFHPTDANRIYLASDGGVLASDDAGVTWYTRSEGLVAAQCYDIAVSDGPRPRYGMTLHDYSAQISNGAEEWVSLGWGEGGSVSFVPGRSDELWADSEFSHLMHFKLGSQGRWDVVRNGPKTASTRRQAIAMSGSDSDPQMIFAIDSFSSCLLRCEPEIRDDWSIVLRPDDAMITCVAIAPSDRRVVVAGDSSGRLWISTDSGNAWEPIWRSPSSEARVDCMCFDPVEATRMFGVVSNSKTSVLYRVDRTKDRVVAFPIGKPIAKAPIGISCHPKLEGGLFSMSRVTVQWSADGGWMHHDSFANLAKVTLMDMCIDSNTSQLALATHGRASWIVDV
jgi:photosystem II stability/assembly factor-like uncharacterized protein